MPATVSCQKCGKTFEAKRSDRIKPSIAWSGKQKMAQCLRTGLSTISMVSRMITESKTWLPCLGSITAHGLSLSLINDGLRN